jgi:hypothetical protein
VATKAALTFVNVADIEKAGARVWQDEHEWLAGVLYYFHAFAFPDFMTAYIQNR